MPRKSAWYKVDGMVVHMHGTNLPAPCAGCQRMSTLLCDWPVRSGVTCDAGICPSCATYIGPDRHLCPTHRDRANELNGPLV